MPKHSKARTSGPGFFPRTGSSRHGQLPVVSCGEKKFVDIIELTKRGALNDIKRLIKENDIDVNERDTSGNSAVLAAAARNDLETLKFLADQGAKFNVKDATGFTPIAYATYHKTTKMITFVNQQLAKENSQQYKP